MEDGGLAPKTRRDQRSKQNHYKPREYRRGMQFYTILNLWHSIFDALDRFQFFQIAFADCRERYFVVPAWFPLLLSLKLK
jgi:hypothetical protein